MRKTVQLEPDKGGTMRRVAVFAGMVFLMVLTGCAGTPKQKYVVAHDPIMDQSGGVVLIADVCIKQDVIGDDDYFVIAESKEGAKALLSSARSFLEEKQVNIHSELVPFVCGSLAHGDKNASLKVAERIGGEIKESQPPFAVAQEISSDPELADALGKLAASAFQHSLIQKANNEAMKAKKALPEPPPMVVSPEELKAATNLIAAKMNAATVLYLGVNGTSISTGKAFAQGLLNVSVGLVTGVATALASGGMVSVWYMPGHGVDWRYMAGGLVNLSSGECAWTGWASCPGDPLKAKVVAEQENLNAMLFNLVHKPDPNEPKVEK
jgi:hypothetical protein